MFPGPPRKTSEEEVGKCNGRERNQDEECESLRPWKDYDHEGFEQILQLIQAVLDSVDYPSYGVFRHLEEQLSH